MIDHLPDDIAANNPDQGTNRNLKHRLGHPALTTVTQKVGFKQYRRCEDRQNQPVIKPAFNIDALSYRFGYAFVFKYRAAKGGIGRADDKGKDQGGYNSDGGIKADNKGPGHPDGQWQANQQKPDRNIAGGTFATVIKNGSIQKQNDRQRHLGKACGKVNAARKCIHRGAVPDAKWQGNQHPGQNHHHR